VYKDQQNQKTLCQVVVITPEDQKKMGLLQEKYQRITEDITTIDKAMTQLQQNHAEKQEIVESITNELIENITKYKKELLLSMEQYVKVKEEQLLGHKQKLIVLEKQLKQWNDDLVQCMSDQSLNLPQRKNKITQIIDNPNISQLQWSNRLPCHVDIRLGSDIFSILQVVVLVRDKIRVFEKGSPQVLRAKQKFGGTIELEWKDEDWDDDIMRDQYMYEVELREDKAPKYQ
ncbi:hypothetical protein RFI_37478, partial [Reticulomyxa filosa]